MSYTKSCTLGVVIGNRDFFPGHLVSAAREQFLNLCDRLEINTVIINENEGTDGGVQSYQDARQCADLFIKHREEITGVVVLLPNFGDEKAVADSIRMAGLNVPVLIQAEEDNLDKMGLATRRDSFCGKISLCNNLRQYGIKYTLTSSHVCAVGGTEFEQDMQRFKKLTRVVDAIRHARVGALGARPASFNTVRYSEKMLERTGIDVETMDLSEAFQKVQSMADNDIRISPKMEALKNNASTDGIAEEKLITMAKLFVVISEWIEEKDLDTTALQCWTSLQQNLGINVCSVMSVMSGDLMPSACEVDVMGALSMYALSVCSEDPAAIADWNNNFGDSADKCVLFHCGNFPAATLENPHMDTADIIGTTVGKENTCGAINGRMKPGAFTYFRLSSDDLEGRLKAYTGEGEVVNDPLDTVGCRAVVQVPGLENLMRHICNNGFEHHVALNLSQSASILEEAFNNYLEIECQRF